MTTEPIADHPPVPQTPAPTVRSLRKLRAASAFFALLTLVSGALFINNVFMIVRWWKAFFASAGDAAALAESGVCGLSPYLDWSAVDQSGITTFIPFFGFLLAWRGIRHSLRSGKSEITPFFPFFPFYDSLNIALGLIGTLWGIILIGYYQMDTVSMADLMQCLHTALFSTFMAVIWVYLLDRPLLRPWIQRLHSAAFPPPPPENIEEDADVISVLERLNEQADNLGATWKTVANGANLLNESANGARASLDALRQSGQIAGSALTDELLGPVRRCSEELRAISDQVREQQQALADAFRQNLDRLASRFENIDKLTNDLASILAENQKLQSILADSMDRIRLERNQLAEKVETLNADANRQKGHVAELEGRLRAQQTQTDDLVERMKRDEIAFSKRLQSLRDENTSLSAGKARAEERAAAAERRALAGEREAEHSRKLLERIRSVFGDRS